MRKRGKNFSLHWRASCTPRLGLVVSRKLAGSAVRRNLVKRQARAVFREMFAEAATGSMPSVELAVSNVDVVVRLAGKVGGLKRAEQFAEMRRLFAHLPKA